MLLKWTAKTFATAAALQLGMATAQDDSLLVPPGPTADTDESATAPGDVPEVRQDQDAAGQEEPEDLGDQAQDAVQREARFAPSGEPADEQPQVNDHIRAATEGLDIDDETRSRYRWHNGEWWFKTRSGQWKFYREGSWQDFDPTTYQSLTPGGASYSPQAGGTYAPQTYSSGGYYYDGGTYRTPRYSGSGAELGRYDGRIYGGSRFYDGRYDGRYYSPGFNNPGYGNSGYGYGYQGPYGTGYRGYDPGTDRYYGRGAFGQPYSIDGDRYRGGVIGSQIGGRIGGNAGAILGGAIGADAAD